MFVPSCRVVVVKARMEVRFDRLSLSEVESEELTLDRGATEDRKYDLCLVGRFLTDCPINPVAMKHQLASLWRPGREVSIRSRHLDRLLIQFYHLVDLERVMLGAPWTFNGHFLLLHPLQIGESPDEVNLLHALFWVQVHSIPMGFMSEGVGKQLGQFLGEFLE